MLKTQARDRILLSVPHMGGAELRYISRAFESNWLSTVGPNINAFETEIEKLTGVPAVALGSGTAAIHLGLRLLGVQSGAEVFCQDLTFVASTNPIRYLGAEPVFIDSNYETWNMDPEILDTALRERARRNRLPKAVITVDLFGQCADMDPITAICNRYEVPVLEDAAEAIGASYKGRPAGTLGTVGVFSFNGNKMITTTSGGMLLCRDHGQASKARFWSTQAREPGLAYDHVEMGYNYRMSNVLAGIGLGQLQVLKTRIAQRQTIASRYRQGFAGINGISIMPEASYGNHTRWLSTFLIDEKMFGCGRDELIRILDTSGIESRPVWKPMHLQKLFDGCMHYGGSVAEELFRKGICLPSSSSLAPDQQAYVINCIRDAAKAPLLEQAEAACGV